MLLNNCLAIEYKKTFEKILSKIAFLMNACIFALALKKPIP